METKIIASLVKSNRSENYVWAVSVTGEEHPQAYCKSSYKALRFAFLLKKRTGFYIADECMKTLLEQMAIDKASHTPTENAPAIEPEPDKKTQKKKRGKKTDAVATT